MLFHLYNLDLLNHLAFDEERNFGKIKLKAKMDINNYIQNIIFFYIQFFLNLYFQIKAKFKGIMVLMI